MTKRIMVLAVCVAALGSMSSARAADCVLHVKRIACAGQEAESYKKCDGKQECDEMKDAATSAAACRTEAQSACANSRPMITKYKSVSSTYKGATLTGGFTGDGAADAAGPNFCSNKQPDFNQCK